MTDLLKKNETNFVSFNTFYFFNCYCKTLKYSYILGYRSNNKN